MDSHEELLALFRHCTVRVSDPANRDEHGTGFFVAPSLLLTCAHVIKSVQGRLASVTIEWNERSYTASIEQCLDESYPDLALLKVASIDNHPCVYLNAVVNLSDSLYSYGYTDNYRDGDSSTFVNEGWTDQQKLLKLKGGEVRHGLSGAPILNLYTGGVCGIAKLTRGVNTPMGGRAVPTTTILREFPQLASLQKNFHEGDKRWQRSLTSRQIQLLNQSAPASDAIEVFYLYADVDKDTRLLEGLDAQLAVMQRQGMITTWHKSRMEPGMDLETEANKHFEWAQIILLMASSDFIVSHYRDSSEVERALARRASGAVVIPVILRSCDWKSSPFGMLQPLPLNGRPIANWSDEDEALLQVAQGIRAVVNRLKNAKS